MAHFEVAGGRRDPYANFRYRVCLGGRPVAGFNKAAVEAPVMKAAHGAADPGVRAKPLQESSPAPIRLERGVTHDAGFEAWAGRSWAAHAGSSLDEAPDAGREDLSICVHDEAGRLVMAYRIQGARVSEFQALPDLDANANALAIALLKIEHQGWTRSPPGEDEPAGEADPAAPGRRV